MTEESDGLNLTKRNNFIVNQTARIFHRNDSTN